MTPRRWYAIATLLTLVAVPMLGTAQTSIGRVANEDCQLASTNPLDPLAIPGWDNLDGTPPTVTGRVDGLGAGQSAACVIVGVGSLRSVAFGVTGGETLTNFSADVWEIRDDCGDSTSSLLCNEPGGKGITRSDSVVALELFTFADTDLDGVADSYLNLQQFELNCDDVVDAYDNGVIDRSDSCESTDTHVSIWAKHDDSAFECSESIDSAGVLLNHRCTKYDGQICNAANPAANDADCTTTSRLGGCACIAPFANPLVVNAGATFGRVWLGGSIALDPLDPLFFGLGLDSPTSITAFDNIIVV